MTAFNHSFLFLDAPGGEVENLAAMKAAGFQGVFCNVHSYDPNDWLLVRTRASANGMFCGPWSRIDPEGKSFDVMVLNDLVKVADLWQAPFIINAEKELDGTGSTWTKVIDIAVGSRDAAISMEGWLFPTVDWKPISRLPMLLQIFPAESAVAHDPDGCKKHAHDLGFKCVYFTFGTYGGMKPSDFDLQHPYSLFTGNAMGGNFSPWSPTSTGFVGCQEEVPPVTETPWYKKPYPKGSAVGPAKLPRVLKPPSKNNGTTMQGTDVDAAKRMVSKAQRWKPWNPSGWDSNYGEKFAMGKGTGEVGDSGVRGFQRQEGITQTGVLDDATYQRMRRALIPIGPNAGKHILDTTSIKLIQQAIYEFSPEAKIAKIRAAISDFCLRAETNEAVWHYSQQRPYTGLGKAPEQSHINDCSSYVVLAYFWARQTTNLAVPDPSGYRYSGYGNTWDDLDGHTRVTSGNFLVGDLAHYDGHVTLCRKAGDANSSVWSSFGTESGPEPTQLFYRGDFVKVVRPPLL